MVIKKNPYSESLMRGLQAVNDLTAPDYILCPVDPTATMAMAGAEVGRVTAAQAREIYMAMMHAWTLQAPGGASGT